MFTWLKTLVVSAFKTVFSSAEAKAKEIAEKEVADAVAEAQEKIENL
jgi:hypothetical protein